MADVGTVNLTDATQTLYAQYSHQPTTYALAGVAILIPAGSHLTTVMPVDGKTTIYPNAP